MKIGDWVIKAPPGAIPAAAATPAAARTELTDKRLSAAAKPQAAAAPEAAASDPATPSAVNPFEQIIVNAAHKALDTKGTAAVTSFQNYTVDMSVPTSPAFTVLGSTPETLASPKSPRDLAVSLAGELADSAKLGKGVGFDINPYMLFNGSTLELATYQDNLSTKVLANSQVSFGAIKQDASQGGLTRVAGGLSALLFDNDDARGRNGALGKCFATEYDKLNNFDSATTRAWVQETLDNQAKGIQGKVTESTSPLLADATKRLSAAYDQCRNLYKATSWNSTRWTAGLAQAYHNRGGGTHIGESGFWTTFGYNLNGDASTSLSERNASGRGQALFHYQHTNREEVASTTDARGFELRRGDMLGVGLKYGSDKRNFTTEFSLTRGRFDTGDTETSRKVAIGGELMITKDFWLIVTVGGQGGQKNGNNSPFVLTGLKFGSASESTGAFGNANATPQRN